jgi:anti-sigma factor RsiW
MMQPYLDRVLSVPEQAEAEAHLAGCEWCAKRYRFEVELRQYVRVAVSEPMPPELKEKLAALRTPLI